MNIRTIVSRLRNSVKEMGNDTYYTNRYLWNVFKTITYKLVNREKMFNNLDVFETYNLEAEIVNLLDGTCVPLDCMVSRVKIPEGIETKNGLIYKYIASPDLSKFYRLVSPNLFKIKFNKRFGVAFREGNYLYFNDNLPCYRAGFLPSDGTSDGEGCSALDNSINLPDYLIDDGIKLALQEVYPSIQKPTDRVVNKSEV